MSRPPFESYGLNRIVRSTDGPTEGGERGKGSQLTNTLSTVKFSTPSENILFTKGTCNSDPAYEVTLRLL